MEIESLSNIRVTTLEHISREDLTDSWNRCWQGYYYNMTYMPDHLRVWLYLSQVSLQHSCAIYDEDKVVGFSLLSMDRSDGWVAGTCIDPDFRRQGLFASLMRTQLNLATRIGLRHVYLEVLEQNHALKVYQSVGFTITRPLNIYCAEKVRNFSDRSFEAYFLEPISVEQYFESRRSSFFQPSWQRREEYLRRYRNCLAVMNLAGTAGALFAGENNVPLLDVWSATAAGAEEVISTVLSQVNTPFSLTNQPEDWIVAYLSAQGIRPSAKQFEMCVSLT